jgi:DNA ligase (NAD+)
MYSLQKFYREDNKQPPDYQSEACTLKLDGASLAAYYINGCLAFVLTRGDGIVGKNITNKFMDARHIPLNIDPNVFGKGVTQFIFECVVKKDYQNARNIAAGTLNLKSLEEFAKRPIELIAHGVFPYPTDDYVEDMYLIKKYLGIRTVATDLSLDEEYPTDGAVYRERSNKAFLELGYTEHHPRGAYALKTKKEEVYTELLDVVWQVGKSGKVTPVAVFDTIDLDGAMVSRASLHNVAFIEALDLNIGDLVGVVRSGEIIPYIVGKITQDSASKNST